MAEFLGAGRATCLGSGAAADRIAYFYHGPKIA
jgi:hypothetical protein